MNRVKILILGGGYGGLKCAITLQKNISKINADITLISKHDYHYQSTLLHKVAVGTYSARKARIYFRKILDENKIKFIKDKIVRIEQSRVIGKFDEYNFDYLVIALGFKPNTFSIKGVDEFAYTLYSVNSALKIRKHIEDKFKDFKFNKNIDSNNDLAFNVCGSGFTGVEFAAELASQSKELAKICGINENLVAINLISKSAQVLPMFDMKLRLKAEEKLKKLGINLIYGSVVECKKDSVVVKNEDSIFEVKAHTTIWTAGVKGNEALDNSIFETKGSRIKVNEFLQISEYGNIFVLGDCAIAAQRDIIHAPTAQLANQMGEYCAYSLIDLLDNKPITKAFKFIHRGTVCSIGHTDGVGFIFNINVAGEIAAFFKNIIENRWILSIGGIINVLKKGQFRFRSSS
ncbi:NAD(P)/FAD-dependent oxidoreductase [Helicobacter sp. MIT 14-3879]|uniref:NAD(P)/FAD-dependent oxidoreductase n=1 Tax=Helicobacter sp. MIT 14-3879 TaxID=2040649 RepID=UPI000E1EF83D|nr:NAD(P)/FAD-dependent oxidoreductase [Helicobacter sp. MIT 14-3879]RDU65230.1 NAD(P)/FAD-dependent oxidoreductase [Helicobacter sp. MIT 14-3879]